MQRQHAGGTQHHLLTLELGADQRHARQLALGDELALVVNDHPGAVQVQAGLGEQGLAHLDAGAGLDGVDEQPGDGAGQVGFGAEAHAAALLVKNGQGKAPILHCPCRQRPRSYNGLHGAYL